MAIGKVFSSCLLAPIPNGGMFKCNRVFLGFKTLLYFNKIIYKNL